MQSGRDGFGGRRATRGRGDRPVPRCLPAGLGLLALLALPALVGCETDGFFDPTQTGRFQSSPTTIPVLDRIDVIEPEEGRWANAEDPSPIDQQPTELTYRAGPEDVIAVDVIGLFDDGSLYQTARRVGAGGTIRLPMIGDVVVAGLTAQEIEDTLREELTARVMADPDVSIVIEGATAFRYVIDGLVLRPGPYAVASADLRLREALATAGGVPPSVGVENIYIVRNLPLSEDVKPFWRRDADREVPTGPASPSMEGRPPGGGSMDPARIDDLIRQLDDAEVSPGAMSAQVADGPMQDGGEPPTDRPGLVDIDDLQPRGAGDSGGQPSMRMPEDEAMEPVDGIGGGEPSFFYDRQRGTWVQGEGRSTAPDVRAAGPDVRSAERIVRIDMERLRSGDAAQNVVIRPDDYIFVEPPPQGFIYIGGEVARPGSYNLPSNGRLTLSRFISTAGGLSAIAIPERVDLIRKVGDDREAVIRLNLAAIRRRTEPDIFLKPDDHILIGTNFWATPLAVLRSGFRITYGFGFLLDRNFGNDVFGPPPTANAP